MNRLMFLFFIVWSFLDMDFASCRHGTELLLRNSFTPSVKNGILRRQGAGPLLRVFQSLHRSVAEKKGGDMIIPSYVEGGSLPSLSVKGPAAHTEIHTLP